MGGGWCGCLTLGVHRLYGRFGGLFPVVPREGPDPLTGSGLGRGGHQAHIPGADALVLPPVPLEGGVGGEEFLAPGAAPDPLGVLGLVATGVHDSLLNLTTFSPGRGRKLCPLIVMSRFWRSRSRPMYRSVVCTEAWWSIVIT